MNNNFHSNAKCNCCNCSCNTNIKQLEVGLQAINFNTQMVDADDKIKEINFGEYNKGKYSVLFFYPLNFTFVCPTEILSLNAKLPEFTSRNAQIFGVSVDSIHSHLAWKNTNYQNGGIGKINFPLISDIKKEISNMYGALNYETGISFRSTIIIDPDFKIVSMNKNIDCIGRNVDEILRIIDAVEHNRKYGAVCPANWKAGSKGMMPNLHETSIFITELIKNSK